MEPVPVAQRRCSVLKRYGRSRPKTAAPITPAEHEGRGIAAGRHIKPAVLIWFRAATDVAVKRALIFVKGIESAHGTLQVLSRGMRIASFRSRKRIAKVQPGKGMILATLAAKLLVSVSLIMPVAVDRSVQWPPPERGSTMSIDQKDAAIRPLVNSATECIARTVSADPRFPVVKDAEFNTLIVESVPTCVDVLRSMIDGYDRLYGDGAGETFFMGPYLDGLPAAVTTRVKGAH